MNMEHPQAGHNRNLNPANPNDFLNTPQFIAEVLRGKTTAVEQAKSVEPSLAPITVLRRGTIGLFSFDLAIIDADETKLKDTLEELHDGPRARFAKAVIYACNNKGLEITEKDFVNNGFWDREFRKFSGLSEHEWLVGLAGCVQKNFKIELSVHELEQSMQKVLKESFKDFASRISPVPHSLEFIQAISSRNLKLGLCTTTRQDIIEPFLQHFGLLDHYEAMEFNADKKLQDPEGRLRFSGAAISRICERLRVKPEQTVMVGDSISDYGACAKAGVAYCILRVPQCLIDKLGYEGALDKLQNDIARAKIHNQDDPRFGMTKVVIVSSFEQVKVIGGCSSAAVSAPAPVSFEKLAAA